MKLICKLLFVSLTLTLSVIARAELTIEITQGVDDATPIAVVPFKGPIVENNLAQIIHDDLARSGSFNTISASSFPSTPSTGSEITFNSWKAIGGDYMVVGQVTPTADGRFDVRYEVFNILTEQRILGEVLTINSNRWRDAGHFIADKIYEKITGVKGAFSTKVAYVNQYRRDGKNRYRLEIADSDGHRSVTILDSHEPVLSPSWSPDAKKIAYVSFETGKPAIYVHTIASNQRTKVADYGGLNGAPAFSPDGTKLALTLSRDGNPEIYILDLSSRNLTRVTNHYAIDTEPKWAPDGRSLIFTSDRGGNPQIYRAELATGKNTRLTFEGNFNAKADISPDGKYLAMVHRQRGQQFQIALLNLENNVLTTLTQSPIDESPSFAPNGKMLAFATKKGKEGVLGVVSIDGRLKVRLPAKIGEVREPAWSPFLN